MEQLQIVNEESNFLNAIRPLTIMVLPHENPGISVRQWEKGNRYWRLTIDAGSEAGSVVGGGRIPVGLPWGMLPRLFIIYLSHEVNINKSKEIELPSFSKYLKVLGLEYTGSIRDRMFDQINRTVLARYLFEELPNDENGQMGKIRNFPIVSEAEFWWNNDKNTKETAYVRVSDDFFEMCLKNYRPLKENIVKKIKNYPLLLDTYIWLNDITYTMKKKSITLPWASLQNQAGSNYKNLRDFKRAYKNMFKELESLNIFRMAKVDEGIVVFRGNSNSMTLTIPTIFGVKDVTVPANTDVDVVFKLYTDIRRDDWKTDVFYTITRLKKDLDDKEIQRIITEVNVQATNSLGGLLNYRGMKRIEEKKKLADAAKTGQTEEIEEQV